MSVPASRLWLSLITIVVAILVLRSLTSSQEPASSPPESSSNSETIIDTRTASRTAPRSPAVSPPRPRHTPAERTTGVQVIDQEDLRPELPVSGYVVDTFANWTAIPPAYFADGLTVHNGAIILSGDNSSTAPRSGTLESPPLPLRQPSLAAPASNSTPLPEGATLELLISVTEDGETWSPWYRVDRHRPVDGKRVSPGMQPTLANAELGVADTPSSVTQKGPALRYRLGLSASGVPSPQITDIRVWKREVQ